MARMKAMTHWEKGRPLIGTKAKRTPTRTDRPRERPFEKANQGKAINNNGGQNSAGQLKNCLRVMSPTSRTRKKKYFVVPGVGPFVAKQQQPLSAQRAGLNLSPRFLIIVVSNRIISLLSSIKLITETLVESWIISNQYSVSKQDPRAMPKN